MALSAGCSGVQSGQRKLGLRIVIECCPLPFQGRMAKRAIHRESSSLMVRIFRIIKVVGVASRASRRYSGILAVHMANVAIDVNMRTCQRKLRLAVIELCWRPLQCRVT